MSDADSLGNDLSEARQQRKLTLAQVEKQTRIRAKFLEALEQENYEALPSIVHTRGFLRNYARFLGMDGDEAVARFDVALAAGGRRRRRKQAAPQATARATQEVRTVSTPQPVMVAAGDQSVPRRGSVIGTLLISLVALLFMATVIALGLQFVQSRLLRSPTTNASVILSPLPNITPSPVISETPQSTDTPSGPTKLPVAAGAIEPTAANGAVTVFLQITERTWLSVIVDDTVKYVGAPAPSTVLKYQGTKIHVRASNALGVHAVINSRDLGPLGARGEIFDQIFTVNGAIKVTSVASPQAALSGPSDSTSLLAAEAPLADTLSATDNATDSSPRIIPTTPIPGTATIRPTTSVPPTAIPATTVVPSATLLPPSPTNPPSATFTPTASRTRIPSATPTPSITTTPDATPLYLPHVTSTPAVGEVRPE